MLFPDHHKMIEKHNASVDFRTTVVLNVDSFYANYCNCINYGNTKITATLKTAVVII